MTKQTFLATIKPMVIKDMQETKILAALTAAQAIIESNWGNSGLAQKGNNLFGIKGSYNGYSVTMRTAEYKKGQKYYINAAFRKYPSWQESINDHSAMFLRMKRYANLVGCTDYIQACRNVQADGYATAPTYAQTLINTIVTYNLQLWTPDEAASTATKTAAAKAAFPVVLYSGTDATGGKLEVVSVFNRMLKKGVSGYDVRILQKTLTDKGYVCDDTGVFDDKTYAAVVMYQKSKGLTADGIVGEKTIRALNI